MEHLWKIHEKSMNNLWKINEINDTSMKHPWKINETSMEPMKHSWTINETSMQSMKTPWTNNEKLWKMKEPWTNTETSINEQNVSETMKSIFHKLFSGKHRKPKSFSKRTLIFYSGYFFSSRFLTLNSTVSQWYSIPNQR